MKKAIFTYIKIILSVIALVCLVTFIRVNYADKVEEVKTIVLRNLPGSRLNFSSEIFAPDEDEPVTRIKPVEEEEGEADDRILYGPYKVAYVIDGDTFFAVINGEEVKIRLIGVDTPESVHQDESRNTPEGKIASDWTKDYLTGRSVYLEYDVQTTDDYGRTLAYVYMEDQTTMLQEELLKAGMATILTIQPNSKYAERFYELQVAAREKGEGFWGA